jgi:hypothetical protein
MLIILCATPAFDVGFFPAGDINSFEVRVLACAAISPVLWHPPGADAAPPCSWAACGC